jgi:hypothetical protein
LWRVHWANATSPHRLRCLPLIPNQRLRYALQTQSQGARLQNPVTIGMLYRAIKVQRWDTQELESK